MSSQAQLDKEEVVEDVFPGAEFAAAREAKGQNIEEVASSLNFSSGHLMAIEEGRLGDLPNRVFALGYLRAYARYLGLDEQKAVADYEHLTGNTPKVSTKPLKNFGGNLDEPKRKSSTGKWMLSLVLFAGLAGGAAWWMNKNPVLIDDSARTVFNVAPEDNASEAVVVEDEMPETPAEQSLSEVTAQSADGLAREGLSDVITEEGLSSDDKAELDVAAVSVVADMTIENSDTVETVTDVVESDVEAASLGETVLQNVIPTDKALNVGVTTEPDPIVAGEGHLLIAFDSDCWVEVRDSAGKLLVASVRSQARGVDVRGPAPMKVTLGALSSVNSMTFNNQAVELTQRGRGNILRMTLPVVE